MGTDLVNTITDESPLTIAKVYSALSKNNCSCPSNHQVDERLRLISFEISSNAKSKALMTYTKDCDSLADHQILKSFENHL